MAAREDSPTARACSPDQQLSEIEELQREARKLCSTSVSTDFPPPLSPLATRQRVRDVAEDPSKMETEKVETEDVMSASGLQSEYDAKAAEFELLAANIDAQLDADPSPSPDARTKLLPTATSELALQLESAKANAKSQAEARTAAEKAKADAELEVRRIKRQFSTELEFIITNSTKSTCARESARAVARDCYSWTLRLLGDTFMAGLSKL